MDVLFSAAGEVLTLQNLLFMSIAMVLGIIAGALPGFSATMAIAVMVPFTFTMSPVSGLVTIGALYCAAIYGGCFSAILLNTPGTPSSIGTTFDGYPMARQGRGEEAIYTATFASGFGGFFGTFMLILFALPLARVALRFGPPEYFWVSIFGLTIIASLSPQSLLKGIAGGFLGLMISMIGIAPVGGDVRFDLGVVDFQGGVELISILIGFFCIPEILRLATNPEDNYEEVKPEGHTDTGIHPMKQGWLNVIRNMGNTVRSSIIGAFVGILPGAGGNIANLVAYSETKRVAKDPETFGKGNPQGIVATESSNNAVVEGAMVPLLALGVPGSPPAAIIYGALLLQGLAPGPELFTTRGDITYAFLFSFIVSNVMIVVFGLLVGKWIYKAVVLVPTRVLIPSILLLTVVGSFAIRNNSMDVIVMFLGGIVGYVMRELEFDPGPVVLGLILGPIAEKGFVQGLIMGNGVSADMPWLIFFTRPLSIVLIVLSVLSAAWPLIRAAYDRHRAARAAEGGAS
ncbi:MAG: tripartite tricarboxylate transporter permease [Candidatus Accumulibacter sp.]|jgi:putative tricarboxylic transport membrane protein|nr:tripartite tricarboxylate transporter permease [Accumulibacter sp.]